MAISNPSRPAMRAVIEGGTPTAHDSVRRALDLLHGPPGDMESLAHELAAGLEGGRADVRVDRPYRLLYATDASIYEMEPVAVVLPRSAADIQHVVRVAARRGVPVLPRGAGTSLAGQGANHAIVVDMTRHMTAVVAIDAEARLARVQPGISIDALNRAAKKHGLMYGADPATKNRATIGGGIGNNSCGSHSVIYGKTLDQVVALDVVLSDGSTARLDQRSGDALTAALAAPGREGDLYRGVRAIARTHRDEIDRRFPRIQRRVSGYNLDEFIARDDPAEPDTMNLARLIVGSEGTLALVTEAVVRLVPLPRAKGVAALHFPSVPEACRATVVALTHAPAAVEIVDSVIIERCRASAGYASLADFVIGDPGALLLVEIFDETDEAVAGRLRAVVDDMRIRGVCDTAVVTTEAGAQARMWRLREAGLGLLMSVRGDTKPVSFVEDTAVPPERLGEFVERFDMIAARHGAGIAHYGHASVGCLHIKPFVNVKASDGPATMERIASEVADLVLEFGGSLSGEHGDGILRGVFTERMFGAQLTEAFREVKRTFDPQGILNPGKILETPPFTDNLRLSAATRSLRPQVTLDWSHELGIAAAAEQCNGQGACLKDEGTMCPSYMITRDEEHSTRGRANLLRQVMNGALPPEELHGDRLREALDLCVECKACLAECPSGVDMTKLKQEVLAIHRREHGVPLRARLFARLRTGIALARLAGPLLEPAQSLLAAAPVRGLLHRLVGIHRDRPLPRIRRRGFHHWFHARAPRIGDPERGPAVFFVDTFTEGFHPEIGRAAVEVLEALGYAVVVVPRLGCCGRPLISSGQLAEAAEVARLNVERLLPWAAAGVPIVGTEPSCILALRDEYLSLLGADPDTSEAARTVAEQALLLDELVARLAAADPALRERFATAAGNADALLHAHCHQKALAGTDPSLGALDLVPGLQTTLVDSACCGMAGAFGYEVEHYDTSLAMAERSLAPAVRAADPATHILVTGASCREQVEHLTGRAARHTAELLADALRR